MNYGLYLSASGVLTNTYRQDVFANNLANVQTDGFKPYIPSVSHRQPESIENATEYGLRNDLLDRLGGGSLAGPQRLSFKVGSPQKTGGKLDAMLPEANHFFQVRDADGQRHLTRDGRLSLNAAGELVTPAGHRLLSPGGQPVRIPAGVDASLDPQGRVIDPAGNVLGELAIVAVDEPGTKLTARGENLFVLAEGVRPTPVADRRIEPGFVEASAVDAIRTLTNLISATKAAMGNARMIQYHDLVMDRAINTLGRVSG